MVSSTSFFARYVDKKGNGRLEHTHQTGNDEVAAIPGRLHGVAPRSYELGALFVWIADVLTDENSLRPVLSHTKAKLCVLIPYANQDENRLRLG